MVRHGLTTWNSEGRFQGHTDVPLSHEGLRQADALGARLASWEIHGCYASDLTRSMDTARGVLQGRHLTPIPVKKLRELSYGEWEGMTLGEVERLYPDRHAQMMGWREEFAPPGGESMGEFKVRVAGLENRLRTFHGEGETLLIVGHGGSLRLLLSTVLELPASASRRFYLANASLTVVDLSAAGAVLTLLNDTSHL